MLVRWVIAAGLMGTLVVGYGVAPAGGAVLRAAVPVSALAATLAAVPGESRADAVAQAQVVASWHVCLSGGWHVAGEIREVRAHQSDAGRLAWHVVIHETPVAPFAGLPGSVTAQLAQGGLAVRGSLEGRWHFRASIVPLQASVPPIEVSIHT